MSVTRTPPGLAQAGDRVPRPVGAVAADPEHRGLIRREVADQLQEHRVDRLGVASGVRDDRGVLERQSQKARVQSSARRAPGETVTTATSCGGGIAFAPPAPPTPSRCLVATSAVTSPAATARRCRNGRTTLPSICPTLGAAWLGQKCMSATLPIERRGLGRCETDGPARRARLRELRRRRLGARAVRAGPDARTQAFALMDAAWELGIDHFDTADAYGGGRSERMIGSWMRSRAAYRPTLTTKTFNPMDAGADHGLAPEADRPPAASRASSGSGSSASSCIWPTSSTRTCRSTRRSARSSELREAGKIGAYGVSNFDAAQLSRGAARRARRPRSRTSTRCSARATRPTCCRCASASRRRVPGVQPAGRRLADRQVPPRRVVPGRVANDPATGAVRAVRRPTDVRPARAARALRDERGTSMAGAGARVAARRRPRHAGRRRPRAARASGAGARGARASAESQRDASELGRCSLEPGADPQPRRRVAPRSRRRRARTRWPRCWPPHARGEALCRCASVVPFQGAPGSWG